MAEIHRDRKKLHWQCVADPGNASVFAVLFLLVAHAPTTSFGRSNALVFAKALGTARSLTDFDGDGYSSILGGGDCAAFDARFSPGTLEIPENGVDDDCSGRDATWPLPPPPPIPANPSPRWNVLLVSIDSLRADHVGAYGYERKTTPNIDKLAAKSLVYLEAYAQAPKTTDSVPSFLTGSYPSNIQRDPKEGRKRKWASKLAPEARPLAMVLRSLGYRTGAGVGFRLNELAVGFDFFEIGHPTKSALKFLESATAPFFLWLHYAEPHDPYERHKRFDFGSDAIDRYDSEIALADSKLGAVLKRLDQNNLMDSTVIIVTADHGEEFGEHGGYSHTRKLYRELLHVPLIVKVPGMKHRRFSGPVELVDIVPTLSELLGIEPRKGEQDGQSLLSGKRNRQLGGAYAEDIRQPYGVVLKRAIFDGRYRLIDDRQNDRLQLYDNQKDKREQREIGHQKPEVLARLREILSVRPLRRHTESFRTLSSTTDADVWALLMPTIRRSEMIDLALDRFPKTHSPALEAVLHDLLERPGLTPEIGAKADQLLASP
jgi:arylsulfatase A-like enzyme